MHTTAETNQFVKVLLSDIFRIADKIERLTGQSCARYLEDARNATTARELADIHSDLCDWLRDVQTERRERWTYWLTEFGWPLLVIGAIIGGIVWLGSAR